MGKLKILADGNSPHAQSNARGKLFEKLMANVLRHYGYTIDRLSNVIYAGMEIDIEGKSIATGIPLYAECKCYESEIDSPSFQKFYAKYMTRWFKDNKSQGIFIALPGLNSEAKGFYRENCTSNSQITVRLYEEEAVLDAISDTLNIPKSEKIAALIPQNIGSAGDSSLLYTDNGFFWIQFIKPLGGGIPNRIVIYDSNSNSISDKMTIDYLRKLYSDLNDFEITSIKDETQVHSITVPQALEEIVEVRGGSECFEYQFPASPEYFIGRQEAFNELESFVSKVLNKETSSKAILFEANSGWGKSSFVLASVADLNNKGHFAVTIDSRSAATSQFILRTINYTLNKFGNFKGLLTNNMNSIALTGFEGGVNALINIGNVLRSNNKILFIFLDQFENIFFLPEALKKISDLLLKICDTQTNIILGFAWKTDLVGLTNEFPYKLRDSIANSAKKIVVNLFSEAETTAMLDKLSNEIRAPLRKDLRFFLSEFSQGYPWLLKKLCAHVKTQRNKGVSQSEIADNLLNVEELFKEDLQGLSSKEEEILHKIAKSAPISDSDLSEEMHPDIIQSLVNRRLVVRIGRRFDIYWDIFRDYLNYKHIPIQENYILRTGIGTVIEATKILVESNTKINSNIFHDKISLSKKSFYNVLHDMKSLGISEIENGKIILKVKLDKNKFDISLRDHLQTRLIRNRLIWELKKMLDEKGLLTIEDVSRLIKERCPYISATDKTWKVYARIFIDWMNFADLAISDSRDNTISQYIPGTAIRERRMPVRKPRIEIAIPLVQYTPIEKILIKITDAVINNSKLDWSGIKKSTVNKSLTMLELLNFIIRKPSYITVLSRAKDFALYPEKRPSLFAEEALKIKSFATFIDILNFHKDTQQTLLNLGVELREKLNTNWENSTAEINAKIMLDWARHSKLAPETFAKIRKGPLKGSKFVNNNQQLLFTNTKNTQKKT